MFRLARALRKPVLVLAAGLVGLSLTAIPAQAQSADAAPWYAPTMIIMDASGSMGDADPGGGRKMDAAKQAVSSFVQDTPAEAQVGLTVFGTGTGSSAAEKAAGCQDVHPRNAATPHKDINVRSQSVPGWYYLAVNVGATREPGPNLAVPVRLDVTVTGNQEPGPRYENPPSGGIFGENATPSGGSAGLPAPAGDHNSVAVGNSTTGSISPTVWIVLAVVGGIVVLAVAFGGLARRRRRAREHVPHNVTKG